MLLFTLSALAAEYRCAELNCRLAKCFVGRDQRANKNGMQGIFLIYPGIEVADVGLGIEDVACETRQLAGTSASGLRTTTTRKKGELLNSKQQQQQQQTFSS